MLSIKQYHKIIISAFLIIIFLISISIVILFPKNIKNIDAKLNFNRDNAHEYIEDQLDIGYRIPGTSESRECVNYFISKFQHINENFTYIIQNFEVHSTNCQNVLFKLNEDEKNIVILGAHYDSRAKATKAGSDRPIPGANDGASGCAVLLELADVLYDKRDDLDCQIWFAFFDAEDQGKDEGGYGIKDWDWIEGSEEFVDNLEYLHDSDSEDFECMILLDMVGGKNLRFIKEEHSTTPLLEELFEIGRQLGYLNEFPLFPESNSVLDDHLPFLQEGIPSADLVINFWNNPDWPHHHTKKDDLSHISKKSLEITGKTIEQFIYNNYLDPNKHDYQGNSPWDEDEGSPYIELILIIITMTIIISSIAIVYIYRKRNSMKTHDD